ncbi:hypothetical protein KAR91_30480 [Candidatus Pacearchaeota archaeon]|nr:hypothetical protein [Candidatus Pacearchaeota archaeon]
MTDTERLDKLEDLIWGERVGSGIALFPTRNIHTGEKGVTIDDLGEEDGSNLGDELTEKKPTLREAIDSL